MSALQTMKQKIKWSLKGLIYPKFEFMGYKIPVHLMNKTGAGQESWEVISHGHMKQYERYCPIQPDHAILEIGCVGRDAIMLTRILSPRGSYLGVDIIEESIEWCRKNISSHFPHFHFFHYNINSPIHNPQGTETTASIRLPLADLSIDRIIVQSVFTHIFEEDVRHYLREFRRVLKSDGLAFISFFVVNQEILAHVQKNNTHLSFRHKWSDHCYIDNKDWPEGGVAYTSDGLSKMLDDCGLELAQPLHRGGWSGLKDAVDGQDIVILRRKND